MNYLTILAKQTLLLALLTTCSFYSYASNVNGKILDVQDDARLYCNEDCELNFFIRIKMAQPINANSNELAPMYFYYNFGEGMEETLDVDIDGFNDYGNTVDNTPIVEYRVHFSIDVSNGNQDELPEHYSLALLTENPRSTNGGFIPYPIEDYKEEDSFFPCHVFDLSFGQQSPAPGCDITGNYIPAYSNEFDTHCKPCFDIEPEPEPGGPKGGILVEPYEPKNQIPGDANPFNGDENPFHTNDHNLSALQIYPNPFSTQLHVPFELKEAAKVDFQVFDATGKIIYQESNPQDAGIHQIVLNTDTWPAGVYYTKAQSGNAIQSYRLVKID